MASEEPQQPEFILVGGESADGSTPSQPDMLSEILQRLDAIAKNLNERSDGSDHHSRSEDGKWVGASGVGGSGSQEEDSDPVKGSVQISDLTKRLDDIEDELKTLTKDSGDNYDLMEEKIQEVKKYCKEIDEYSSHTSGRTSELEETMANIQARQVASETNAVARMLNNRCLSGGDRLVPLVSIKNQQIYEFPITLALLDSLPLDKVNSVLEQLGHSTENDVAKGRKRVAHLAGCVTVAN